MPLAGGVPPLWSLHEVTGSDGPGSVLSQISEMSELEKQRTDGAPRRSTFRCARVALPARGGGPWRECGNGVEESIEWRACGRRRRGAGGRHRRAPSAPTGPPHPGMGVRTIMKRGQTGGERHPERGMSTEPVSAFRIHGGVTPQTSRSTCMLTKEAAAGNGGEGHRRNSDRAGGWAG